MSRWNRNRLCTAARRGAVAAMALTLGLAPVPYITREAIALASADASVLSWDATFDGSSYVFTIDFANDVYSGNHYLAVSYDDGTQGNANSLQLTWDCSEVKGGYYQDIPGASTSISGNTVTVGVPASYFGGKSFTVTYCGSSITSAQMGGASVAPDTPATPDEPETPATPSEPATPETPATPGEPETGGSADTPSGAYAGIAIDGDFSDWDAVAKAETDATVGWGHVNRMAMVWDGDWVYLYLESVDSNPASMTGAGPSGNGKYAITTDLGNQTLVDLSQAPNRVLGIDGATIAANSTTWGQPPYRWEVAIPASALGPTPRRSALACTGRTPPSKTSRTCAPRGTRTTPSPASPTMAPTTTGPTTPTRRSSTPAPARARRSWTRVAPCTRTQTSSTATW